tara:strand:+ start:169 stop:567 length:399 start_codon:yes stop_codon:yes gene_type:complete
MSTVKAANLQNTGSGAPAFKNSSGTEIGQLCKARVSFNGVGTLAIRDSFNVSSVTDGGTGTYTINFTNSMPNENYAVTGTSSWNTLSWGATLTIDASVYSTSSLKIRTFYVSSGSSFILIDSIRTSVAFFGD